MIEEVQLGQMLITKLFNLSNFTLIIAIYSSYEVLIYVFVNSLQNLNWLSFEVHGMAKKHYLQERWS